jgi:hypothetical protein
MPKTDEKSPKIVQELTAWLTRLIDYQPAELPKLDRLLKSKQVAEIVGWHQSTILKEEALVS